MQSLSNPSQAKLRIAYDAEPQPLQSSDFQIQQILILLHKELRAPHRIADLALQMEISPRQFERRFKEATGYTLRQYLKKIRLEKASELLATTFLSIKEIGGQVRLEEITHFVRDFEKVYGLTPVQYRKRMYGRWRDVASR